MIMLEIETYISRFEEERISQWQQIATSETANQWHRITTTGKYTIPVVVSIESCQAQLTNDNLQSERYTVNGMIDRGRGMI